MRQFKISKSITLRDTLSIERYLSELNKIPLITPDEEVALAKRIKKGDVFAIGELVKANLRFVVSVAKQYQNKGLPLEDLINEGNLGLVKAAERYDATRGFRFISYGVWWIRQSIMAALSDHHGPTRVPSNVRLNILKIYHATSSFLTEFERVPTVEELSGITNLSEDMVSETIQVMERRSFSLDSPIPGIDGSEINSHDTFADTESRGPDQDVERFESLSHDLNQAFSILTDQQKKVLILYFGIGQPEGALTNFEDIAERLKVSSGHTLTVQTIRLIKDKALHKLRAHSKVKPLLKKYLGV